MAERCRVFSGFFGQCACTTNGRFGELHRQIRRKTRADTRRSHRFDQMENIGRTTARNRGDRAHLVFALKAHNLPNRRQQRISKVEHWARRMSIANDGRDPTTDRSGRVWHRANDWRLGTQHCLISGNRDPSCNRQEHGRAIAQRLQGRQGITHHLWFHRDQNNRWISRERLVHVHPLRLEPIAREWVVDPNRRCGKSRLQPARQHSRTHFTAAQQNQSAMRNIIHIHENSPCHLHY